MATSEKSPPNKMGSEQLLVGRLDGTYFYHDVRYNRLCEVLYEDGQYDVVSKGHNISNVVDFVVSGDWDELSDYGEMLYNGATVDDFPKKVERDEYFGHIIGVIDDVGYYVGEFTGELRSYAYHPDELVLVKLVEKDKIADNPNSLGRYVAEKQRIDGWDDLTDDAFDAGVLYTQTMDRINTELNDLRR